MDPGGRVSRIRGRDARPAHARYHGVGTTDSDPTPIREDVVFEFDSAPDA